MINKKKLLKIFIIFFIAISSILICNTSNARISISNTSITVYENQTTTVTIETDHVLKSNKIIFKRNALNSTITEKGIFSCNTISSTRKGMMTTLTVEIKGIKAGSAQGTFLIGDNEQETEIVYITIKESNSSGGSGSNGGGGSSGGSSSSGGISSSGESGSSGGTKLNLDITDENFLNQYEIDNYDGIRYSRPFTNIIVKVVNNILGILQLLGVVVLVLSLALAGINGILAANEDFAEDLGLSLGVNINEYGAKLDGVKQLNKGALTKIIRRAIIGSFILFMSASIVKIIFKLLTGI